MEYGLIGNPLSHSYSKEIHTFFDKYNYELNPLSLTELDEFMKTKDFKGINVTIPYKEEVMKYCATVSPLAKKIGSINTIVKDENGNLHGYNTDYQGMSYCAKRADIDFTNKDVVILGSGGTSKTAKALVLDSNCKSLQVVSREGSVNYENVYDICKNAQIIINATPVGMYPKTDASPVDLSKFPNLDSVLDVIYNPLHTSFLQQAEDLGLKSTNGLSMLIAQAVYASKLFINEEVSEKTVNDAIKKLTKSFSPIALIGMPGSGKTSIGKALSQKLNLNFSDTDELIEKKVSLSIPEIFSKFGEKYFRDTETEIIKDISSKPNGVISLGGGSVLKEENRHLLRRNSIIIHIKRDINSLSTENRPLSKDLNSLKEMEKIRLPIYNSIAHFSVDNNEDIGTAVNKILKYLE